LLRRIAQARVARVEPTQLGLKSRTSILSASIGGLVWML
jgi:hypothetical protein